MKKYLPNILAVIAALNLVWLFVFNYKIPFISSDRGEKEVMAEEALTEEENTEEALTEQENTEEALPETEASSEQAAQEPQESAAPETAAENTQETAAPAAAQEPETQTPEPAPAPEPAPEPKPEAPAQEEKHEVTCRPLEGNTPNIRSGPGTDYDILKTADFDEVMTVRGTEVEGWLPVRTNDGKEGYVSGDMVYIID